MPTEPIAIRLPWFTLVGTPNRPGRLSRLRCVAAMAVHEAVELIAGTRIAHSMRAAERYAIGGPVTITVPASRRNNLYLTTVGDFPYIYGDLVNNRAVELRVYASGTVVDYEQITNPGPLVEVRIANPVTGEWELVGNEPWNFLGAYDGGASYAIGDVVTYDGSTWYRLDANGGNTGDTPAEGTFWTQIAAKGDTGVVAADAPITYDGPTQTVGITIGTTAGTAAAGDDARFTDARTPLAHASSHQDGGSDELALDASQTTSGVFNTARLGTGTADAYHFLDGTGTWTDDVPVLVPCKNTSGSTIAKGAPVYVTGTVGATSVIEIAPADADNAATMPAIGLLNSELIANATGYVVVVGSLKGLNTNSYSINQALYVSTTAGTLTGTKPTGSTELIQNIGRVTRVNSHSGEVIVLGPGRTNDVPNAIDAGKLTSGTVAYARLPVGTTSSTVAAGDDSRLTDSRSPSGSAGGDLSGTYPNPSIATGAVTSTHIANGTIVNADISASAAIATSKISGLATVATSGAASDLTGTLTSAQLPNVVPAYGTGVDGDVTISGTTTLTSDMHYNNLTVTGTLNTANFRVFVAGTLSGNGIINVNGNAGGAAITGQVFASSGAGAAGTSSTGGTATAVSNRLGGSGGAGGNGTGGNGGTAQTGTALAANGGGTNLVYDWPNMSRGTGVGNVTTRVAGGVGGSGGGGNGTGNGGQGGGGAGIVYLGARTITFTGAINAVGGAGSTPVGNNCGGGGGGGGGVVVVVTGSSTQTFTSSVAGGVGGNGTGTGIAGSTGGSGQSVVYLGVK